MNKFTAAFVYVGFFGLIGTAIYLTGSAWCLWALIFTPTYEWDDSEEKDEPTSK